MARNKPQDVPDVKAFLEDEGFKVIDLTKGNNVNASEGHSTIDVPHDEPGGSGTEQEWCPPGADAEAIGTADIHAPAVDTPSGSSGKRRGRPPGSGKGSASGPRGTAAADRQEWRESVAYTTSLLVSYGFGGFGRWRASRYRRIAPEVEQAIAKAWTVPVNVSQQVGVPLASFLEKRLPEKARKAVGEASEPAVIVAGLWSIAQHCTESEKRILAEWQERKSVPNEPNESGLPDTSDVSASPV